MVMQAREQSVLLTRGRRNSPTKRTTLELRYLQLRDDTSRVVMARYINARRDWAIPPPDLIIHPAQLVVEPAGLHILDLCMLTFVVVESIRRQGDVPVMDMDSAHAIAQGNYAYGLMAFLN